MKHSVSTATITGDAAHRAAGAALETANKMDKSIFVAVVSASGQLLAFAGHHNTPQICHQLCQDKAYTAVVSGMATSQWKAYVESCPQEEQDLMNRQPRYIAAEGGRPIFEDGKLIGGIGVSGAGQMEDDECAAAGIVALGLE